MFEISDCCFKTTAQVSSSLNSNLTIGISPKITFCRLSILISKGIWNLSLKMASALFRSVVWTLILAIAVNKLWYNLFISLNIIFPSSSTISWIYWYHKFFLKSSIFWRCSNKFGTVSNNATTLLHLSVLFRSWRIFIKEGVDCKTHSISDIFWFNCSWFWLFPAKQRAFPSDEKKLFFLKESATFWNCQKENCPLLR